jgi:hypothetical protein
MKAVLEDATAVLPKAQRTSSMKAEIASRILASAAKGERDPIALKVAALLAIAECALFSRYLARAQRCLMRAVALSLGGG